MRDADLDKICGVVEGVVNEFNGTPDTIDYVFITSLELFATVLVGLPEDKWDKTAAFFVKTAQKRATDLKSSGGVKFFKGRMQ